MLDKRQGNPCLFRGIGAWGYDQVVRLQCRDAMNINRIIGKYHNFLVQALKILYQVPGEGIVIIDNQYHGFLIMKIPRQGIQHVPADWQECQ